MALLSVRNQLNLMSRCPTQVLETEISISSIPLPKNPAINFYSAEASGIVYLWSINPSKNFTYQFITIFRMVSIFIHHFSMVMFHMFRMIFAKFKVPYSIIRYNAVLMVDTFISFKFSSKILFHNISMLKNSFSVYIYTKITQWRKARLSFFQVIPIRRNIIISMSEKSASVHLADMVFILAKNVETIRNCTNHFCRSFFIGSHKDYYNVWGNKCQW